MTHHGFPDRLIDWSTLDRPTRRVIRFGFALLLVLAGLTALPGLLAGPPIFAVTYRLPLAVPVVTGLALAAAVALMLAGTATARSPWRFAGLLGVAGLGFALLQWRPSAGAEAAARFTQAAAVFFALTSTALIAFGRRLSVWIVLALTAVSVAVTVALMLAPSFTAGATSGANVVVLLMIVVVMAALPAIVVVGWDLAEVAAELSGPAVRALGRTREHAAAVVVITLGAALAIWLCRAHHLSAAAVLYRSAALGVLALAFAGTLSGPKTTTSHAPAPVGYFHVLLFALTITLTMWAPVVLQRDADGVFNAHTGHEFSVKLADGWQVVHDLEAGLPQVAANRSGKTNVHFAPQGRPGLPRLTVQAYPLTEATRTPPATINVRLAGGELVRLALVNPKASGTDTTASLTFRDAAGETYIFDSLHRVLDNRGPFNAVFWFSCLYKEVDRVRIEPACDAIVGSFRTDSRMAPIRTAHLFVNEIVWALLALICLAVLVLWPSAGAGVAFLGWAAIVVAVRNAGATLGGQHDEIASAVSLSAGVLAAALALGCVCALVAVVARNRAPHWAAARTQAFSFLAALVLAAVFFELYVRAAEASGHSHQIRGAVVCLALVWEFWTSGSLVTNRDSAGFPRAARIMFYLGYLLAVATIVFFWVELPRAAGRAQKAFEPELYVATGIACLGLPFLIHGHLRAYLEARAAGSETTKGLAESG